MPNILKIFFKYVAKYAPLILSMLAGIISDRQNRLAIQAQNTEVIQKMVETEVTKQLTEGSK